MVSIDVSGRPRGSVAASMLSRYWAPICPSKWLLAEPLDAGLVAVAIAVCWFFRFFRQCSGLHWR